MINQIHSIYRVETSSGFRFLPADNEGFLIHFNRYSIRLLFERFCSAHGQPVKLDRCDIPRLNSLRKHGLVFRRDPPFFSLVYPRLIDR